MATRCLLMVASRHRFNHTSTDMTRLYVVMGVAGSGKSSIGAMVADSVGGTYIDGDDFHPQANINKMSQGEALTDEDRWPWLESVAKELASIDGIGFIGCSALKKSYRELITNTTGESVTFIYLSGSKELIASRMARRKGHFMPTQLLESQFATLEVPTEDENSWTIDIDATREKVVQQICKKLGYATDS